MTRRGAARALRVEEVMSGAVVTVSSQLAVEEAARLLAGPAERGPFAVVDRAGHVVGALDWEDIQHVPRAGRPARLVGEVPGHGALVEGSAEVAEALARPALAGVDTAIVVDARRDPVGFLHVDDARDTCPAPHQCRHSARSPSGAARRG